MQVSVEQATGLQRRIRVRIPPEEVEQAVAQKVRRVGRHAKLSGFRPGKIPLKVLVQRYGDAARAEVTNELVKASYPKALDEVRLKPAGQPKVELDEAGVGRGLSFTAEFDVYPEIELKWLDGLRVTRPVAEITDEDVDLAIASLRERNKEYSAVERVARAEDRVRIDYQGRLDGALFDGGSGEDVEVVLGSGQVLADLEQALHGHAAGAAFDVPVTFPADYGVAQLAGRQAKFHLQIKDVCEPRLPEIDALFLRKLGIDEGGEAVLREKARESLVRDAQQNSEARVRKQVLDGLYQANPIEVPESLVAREMDTIRREAGARLGSALEGGEARLREIMPDAVLHQGALRRAALGLLMSAVISEREITLDENQVDARLDRMIAGNDQADQIKSWYRSRPDRIHGLEAMVMESQVVESLLGDAQVEEQKMTLDDLMKGRDS